MEYGAIDLHLRRSQIRIVDETEQVILDRRVDTTRGTRASLFRSPSNADSSREQYRQ